MPKSQGGLELENNKSAWLEISRFFGKQSDDIKDHVCADLKDMWSLDVETLKMWAEATAYEGFDVVKMLKLLAKRHKAYKAESHEKEDLSVKYVKDGENKKFEFSNQESLPKEMCFMIMVFLQRGSNWDKMYDKSKDDVKKILSHIKDKYNIDTSKRPAGQSIGSEVVTIPRIAACFPLRLLQFLQADIGRVIIDIGEVGVDPEKVPSWMQHNAVASVMLPSCYQEVCDLNVLVFAVHVLTDEILHKKDRKFTKLRDIFTYMEAARNSPAVPKNARRCFWIGAGMAKEVAALVRGFEFLPDKVPPINKAGIWAKLREIRPNEGKDFEVVMAMVEKLCIPTPPAAVMASTSQ